MLVIQALRGAGRLPILMIVGLIVMFVAGALDVFGGAAATAHQHAEHGFMAQHSAHLLALAGMVLVLVGLVTHGARRNRRPRVAKHGGLHSDAHR